MNLKQNESYYFTVLQLWEKFISEGAPMPKKQNILSPKIYESWKRSLAWKIPSDAEAHRAVSNDELALLMRKNDLLINTARTYMRNLYSFVSESGFAVVLASAEGVVLFKIGGNKQLLARMQVTGLDAGAIRAEQVAGTNGIGTCLVLDEPIQIVGPEHYLQVHHSFTCSAAPIHGPDGKIHGCVDLVGPADEVHDHTLGMVVSAVIGIESELKLKMLYEQLTVASRQLTTIFHAIDEGLLIMNREGIVLRCNSLAERILDRRSDEINGGNINKLLGLPFNSENPLGQFSSGFLNREIHIDVHGNDMLVSVSTFVTKEDSNDSFMAVVRLDEMKKLHHIANRMSGFQAQYTMDDIIGESKCMSDMKKLMKMAASSDSNVLILGESGTGKELIAHAIHNASDRKKGPFIAINCASVPKNLMESEFFGYERGAFTGANKEGQPGKFELADGGTIFLDEIGDMRIDHQAVLLRVIQSHEIMRIGGKKRFKVDVRIIAATNRNLKSAILDGSFREDLYYRLNVLPIELAPLRQRDDDIIMLANSIIQRNKLAAEKGISLISADNARTLKAYSWPGNIRELENVIERSVVYTEGSELDLSDFRNSVLQKQSDEAARPVFTAATVKEAEHHTGIKALKDMEYESIVSSLRRCRGNISECAVLLKISRRTLYRKMEKYGISTDEFRRIF